MELLLLALTITLAVAAMRFGTDARSPETGRRHDW